MGFDLERSMAKVAKECNDGNINYHLYLSLFKEYSKTEIKSFDELYNTPENFHNMLVSNIDIFTKLLHPNMDYANIVDRLRAFGKSFISSLQRNRNEQKEFVDAIGVSADLQDFKILDVGPGSIPHSSILLGNKADNVCAIEDGFYISDECLENFNVSTIDGYFDTNSDISGYNMVVGRMPCTAIDSIVYLCAKHKKQYFIETCNCNMPTIADFNRIWSVDVRTKDSWYGWQDMLPGLDAGIGSFGSYVYHVEDNDGLTRYLEYRAQKKKEEKKNIESEQGNTVYSESMAEAKFVGIAADEIELD